MIFFGVIFMLNKHLSLIILFILNLMGIRMKTDCYNKLSYRRINDKK